MIFNGVLLDQGALEAIPRLGALPECYALAAATLHLLSLEPPHLPLDLPPHSRYIESGAKRVSDID